MTKFFHGLNFLFFHFPFHFSTLASLKTTHSPSSFPPAETACCTLHLFSDGIHFWLFCADAFSAFGLSVCATLVILASYFDIPRCVCFAWFLYNFYCWLVKQKMLPLPSCHVCHAVGSLSQPWHIYAHTQKNAEHVFEELESFYFKSVLSNIRNFLANACIKYSPVNNSIYALTLIDIFRVLILPEWDGYH